MEIKSTPSTKIRYKDYGILILRIGIGLVLLVQCIHVFTGNSTALQTLQGNMSINSTAATHIVEIGLLVLICVGAILYLLGYFTRFISTFLSLAFFLTFLFQFVAGASFEQISFDLNMSVVFFASIFLGGGKLSLDYKTNHYKISLENSTAI